jgi:hypothetical protein
MASQMKAEPSNFTDFDEDELIFCDCADCEDLRDALENAEGEFPILTFDRRWRTAH